MGDTETFSTVDRFSGGFEQPGPDPLPPPAECDAHASHDEHSFFYAEPDRPADPLGVLGHYEEIGGSDGRPVGSLPIEGGDTPVFIGRGDPNREHPGGAQPSLALDGGRIPRAAGTRRAGRRLTHPASGL